MECNVFRKRLPDLIEDSISFDMKEAMLQHICDCEACREVYEEELSIDDIFTKGLSVSPDSFRSLRSDIMKNIDKNRYGKGPFKKFLFHIKKYKGTYTTMAAVLLIAVFITPYIAKNSLFGSAKKNEQFSVLNEAAGASKESAVSKSEENNKASLSLKTADIPEQNNEVKTKTEDLAVYMPKFEKKVLDKTFKAAFNTPWENSLSKKYTATVEGKGEEAQEEGIANIVIKNLSADEQWSFSLVDNQEKQFTPKKIKWIDDENMLVTIGLGYGTVEQGGDLYILNTSTAELTKANPMTTFKAGEQSQVTRIVSVKLLPSNELEVTTEVLIYEDELKDKSHTENRTIIIPFDGAKK